MPFPRGLAALLLAAGGASAACTSDLLIDDFSSSNINLNTVGSWTSDDGSMISIALNSGSLVFTPASGGVSYFYETFPCQTASADGYDAISFTASGPDGASLALELQTRSDCGAGTSSSYFQLLTGLTASPQTFQIPLSSWTNANANAVTAIVWSGFSVEGQPYVLDNVKLACGGGGGGPVVTSATTSSSTPTTTSSSPPTTSTAVDGCTPLLIDDWTSQSRLSFLFYNAMLEPSSDDGTMQSLVVAENTLALTPTSTSSYFYSIFDCVDAQASGYGGVAMRINAPAGSTFDVQFTTVDACGGGGTESYHYVTSAMLGWTFDGTDKLFDVPFSAFSGLTPSRLQSILFTNLNNEVVLGPMAFYCGSTPSEYVVAPPLTPGPTTTEAAPASTAAAGLVIDTFGSTGANDLGFWHGFDDGMDVSFAGGQAEITSSSSDFAFYTLLSATCRDMNDLAGSYLHVSLSGSNKFTIAMVQHNSACDDAVTPFPETWDSLEAARYDTGSGDIYIPVDHFNINLSRVQGLSFKGFYTTDPTVLKKVEIVSSVPSGVSVPVKLPSGNLVFSCKRPNSFAFAIDDGVPELAQQVLDIIREEDIKVTFFTVGAPLLDASTNLSSVYSEMLDNGHQVALHSYTHPPMEGLPSEGAIDWEYTKDIQATEQMLSGAGFDEAATSYFRPPFGNEGARMRQRLCAVTGDPEAYIVNWTVDVEDWLWGTSDTPEKQLDAFQRDVDKGGNLVVLHYLYPSTVGYLRQFIQIAKATGKDLMRVDQCMEDPRAPPL